MMVYLATRTKDYKALEDALMEATGHRFKEIGITPTEQIDKSGKTLEVGFYVHAISKTGKKVGGKYTQDLVGNMSFDKKVTFISKQLLAGAKITYRPLLWNIQAKIRRGL